MSSKRNTYIKKDSLMWWSLSGKIFYVPYIERSSNFNPNNILKMYFFFALYITPPHAFSRLYTLFTPLRIKVNGTLVFSSRIWGLDNNVHLIVYDFLVIWWTRILIMYENLGIFEAMKQLRFWHFCNFLMNNRMNCI